MRASEKIRVIAFPQTLVEDAEKAKKLPDGRIEIKFPGEKPLVVDKGRFLEEVESAPKLPDGRVEILIGLEDQESTLPKRVEVVMPEGVTINPSEEPDPKSRKRTSRKISPARGLLAILCLMIAMAMLALAGGVMIAAQQKGVSLQVFVEDLVMGENSPSKKAIARAATDKAANQAELEKLLQEEELLLLELEEKRLMLQKEEAKKKVRQQKQRQQNKEKADADKEATAKEKVATQSRAAAEEKKRKDIAMAKKTFNLKDGKNRTIEIRDESGKVIKATFEKGPDGKTRVRREE